MRQANAAQAKGVVQKQRCILCVILLAKYMSKCQVIFEQSQRTGQSRMGHRRAFASRRKRSPSPGCQGSSWEFFRSCGDSLQRDCQSHCIILDFGDFSKRIRIISIIRGKTSEVYQFVSLRTLLRVRYLFSNPNILPKPQRSECLPLLFEKIRVFQLSTL